MPVRTAPASLSAADARLRAEYVREVLAVLYPEPDEAVPGTEYVLIPDARRPRLLVPAAERRVAAAAVARYAEPQSRLARLKRDAVVAALRTGASAALLRDRAVRSTYQNHAFWAGTWFRLVGGMHRSVVPKRLRSEMFGRISRG